MPQHMDEKPTFLQHPSSIGEWRSPVRDEDHAEGNDCIGPSKGCRRSETYLPQCQTGRLSLDSTGNKARIPLTKSDIIAEVIKGDSFLGTQM